MGTTVSVRRNSAERATPTHTVTEYRDCGTQSTLSPLAANIEMRHDTLMQTDTKGMPRLDKTIMVVETLDTMTDDSSYWAKQTPAARLAALELMRRINYGHAVTGRLQRVLEVVERSQEQCH